MITLKSDFGDDLMPRRATVDAAGYDMYMPTALLLEPGKWYSIDTGIHLEKGDIKDNQYLLVVPRSGLGFKYGLVLTNTVGIIDSAYTDSIKAKVKVDKELYLEHGDRFMQFIVCDSGRIAHEIVPTAERNGGLGSTGRK